MALSLITTSDLDLSYISHITVLVTIDLYFICNAFRSQNIVIHFLGSPYEILDVDATSKRCGMIFAQKIPGIRFAQKIPSVYNICSKDT